MATVYKVKITLVSPWTAYDEETIKEGLEKIIKDKTTKSKLEIQEIKVTKIA